MKSESIKELAAALSKAQGQFDHAKKDVKNDFFRSKYADLASVIDAAKIPLSENGLSVAQVVDTDQSGQMYLETTLMHLSGEWISGCYPIRPMKNDPQSVGSAITYARRYAFSAITGIAADDDDGNEAIAIPKKTMDNGNQKHEQQQIDYSNSIKSATSREELISVWQTIPKTKRKQYEEQFKQKNNEFITTEV